MKTLLKNIKRSVEYMTNKEFDKSIKKTLDRFKVCKKRIGIVNCEKCGKETSVKLVGDESYDYCSECDHATE